MLPGNVYTTSFEDKTVERRRGGQPGGYTPSVEADGAVVRGLAVPYDRPALIRDSDGVWLWETVDKDSFTVLPPRLPLRVEHATNREPAGLVNSLHHTAHGLGMEGELVGGDHELEAWARRFKKGISTGLSISFAAPKFGYRPPGRDGLPTRLLRKAQLREVSLVDSPAYDLAGVSSLSVRHLAAQISHEESEKAIAEAKAMSAEVAARRKRREQS